MNVNPLTYLMNFLYKSTKLKIPSLYQDYAINYRYQSISQKKTLSMPKTLTTSKIFNIAKKIGLLSYAPTMLRYAKHGININLFFVFF